MGSSSGGRPFVSAAGVIGSSMIGADEAARSTGLRRTAVSLRVSGGAASGVGAQVRHLPSTAFQQSLQVYCRHVRQKLNVRWNASRACVVERCSRSERATANASSNDVSGSLTKCFKPRPSVPMAPSGPRLASTASNV